MSKPQDIEARYEANLKRRHNTEAPATAFDDPRVQTVYGILCADEKPPAEQHWEGWAARRIVDALSAPAAQDEREALTVALRALDAAADVLDDIARQRDQHEGVARTAAVSCQRSADIVRLAARAPQTAAEGRIANLEAEFVRAKSALANRMIDAFEYDAATPQPTVQAEKGKK